MNKTAFDQSSTTQQNPAQDEWNAPAILLVDLDAFFASVEQLDHPEWRNKPVIVGGSPEKRGVVSTASYEARKFGVHSAMPSSTAACLCPQAIWTGGNFKRYKEMSQQVMDILYSESPHLMQVSIDEAFLDISPTRVNREYPALVAKRIQNRVAELGITCSIGLGTSKIVAKIASDKNKPSGLTIIKPGQEQAFLFPLPVCDMSGIGPKAQQALRTFGITTLGELASADKGVLQSIFGKNTETMRLRCFGIDTPVVDDKPPAKSVSNEISLAKSTADISAIKALIATAAHKVGRRLRKQQVEGSVLHLKIRFEDLSIRTCQRKISDLGSDDIVWLAQLYDMLFDVWNGYDLVRLIGVGVSGFEHEPVQTALFNDAFTDTSQNQTKPKSKLHNPETSKKILEATDKISERFGESSVLFGNQLKMKQKTTGSSAKNPADYLDS